MSQPARSRLFLCDASSYIWLVVTVGLEGRAQVNKYPGVIDRLRPPLNLWQIILPRFQLVFFDVAARLPLGPLLVPLVLVAC